MGLVGARPDLLAAHCACLIHSTRHCMRSYSQLTETLARKGPTVVEVCQIVPYSLFILALPLAGIHGNAQLHNRYEQNQKWSLIGVAMSVQSY